MTKLSAMRWPGGKSANSPTGTGAWIARHLPVRELYAEVYGGMTGILLQRPRSRFEVVNDLDGRITNWWNVVRDDALELARLVEDTPRGRPQFDWALASQYDEGLPPIRRALAFTVVNLQSGSTPGVYGNDLRVIPDWRRGLPESLPQLKRRMKDVRIERRPALDLLREYAAREDSVVYVDPPYRNTAGFNGLYGHADENDLAELPDVLASMKGAVAISGYDDHWDELGWERREYRTYTPIAARKGKETGSRVEVLWTNFTPDAQMELA